MLINRKVITSFRFQHIGFANTSRSRRSFAIKSTINFQEVLNFWFKPPTDPEYGKAQRYWFMKDPAFDNEIRTKFGDLIIQGLNGELASDWEKTDDSTLAHIIVLDQFARNVYRGNALSYAGADLAINSALKLIDSGADKKFPMHIRSFIYLPFMHAESVELQARSVSLYEGLVADFPDASDNLKYAKMHEEVILKFGRFPQRNEALGRASTPEELEYSANGGGF